MKPILSSATRVAIFAAAALSGVTIFSALRLSSQAAPPAPVIKAARADGTTRQTAQPWTGSPYGPGNDFESADRARTLKIEQVMNDLRLRPGTVVGDIGAGGGWFTLLAARRVGPGGRVYAEEILPKYTRFIAERAQQQGLKNVRVVLGRVNDPKLPPNTLDAALILNAYHEFAQPLAMLRKIKAALKPGARLAFIERDDDNLRLLAADAIARTGQAKHRVDERPDGKEWTDDHRLALPLVEREAATVGLRKVTAYELEADNYILIVQK